MVSNLALSEARPLRASIKTNLDKLQDLLKDVEQKLEQFQQALVAVQEFQVEIEVAVAKEENRNG